MSCFSVCDYNQPCKNFNIAVQRTHDDDGNVVGDSPLIQTLKFCDKKINGDLSQDMLTKFQSMIKEDDFIGSALATYECQPSYPETPCVFNVPQERDFARNETFGVCISASGYYNNALLAYLVGGDEYVGNMLACRTPIEGGGGDDDDWLRRDDDYHNDDDFSRFDDDHYISVGRKGKR